MPFCGNCGTQLVEHAKFCHECGSSTSQYTQHQAPVTQYQVQQSQPVRQVEYAGKVVKCPNCGNHLDPRDVVCPACSHEIVGKSATLSVQQFAQKVMELESFRADDPEQTKSRGALGTAVKGYFDLLNPHVSVTDRQIVSLIQSFPIPNTIEEITEFMFLAASNINVSLSKRSIMNNPGSANVLSNKGTWEKSEAWVAKMQQAYQKATMLFSDDPLYAQIDNLYRSKMKELKIKVD